VTDKGLIAHLEKRGLRGDIGLASLRAARKALISLSEPDPDHSGWSWCRLLLGEVEWRLAIRTTETTKRRKHFAPQEDLDKEFDKPYCGHWMKRENRKDSHTHDLLSVTCLACWKRLAAEAAERVAIYEKIHGKIDEDEELQSVAS